MPIAASRARYPRDRLPKRSKSSSTRSRTNAATCSETGCGLSISSVFARVVSSSSTARRIGACEPRVDILEGAQATLTENQSASQMPMQVDIEGAHDQTPRGTRPANATSTPKVLRTARVLPSWQVGLPFSRSMTNRNPVPAAMASSRCVTPSDRRVLLTVLPISSTDTATPRKRSDVTDREYQVPARRHATKCYRSGMPTGDVFASPTDVKLRPRDR